MCFSQKAERERTLSQHCRGGRGGVPQSESAGPGRGPLGATRAGARETRPGVGAIDPALPRRPLSTRPSSPSFLTPDRTGTRATHTRSEERERAQETKRPKKENMNKAVTLCGLLATNAPELLVGQGGRRPQGDGYNGHVPLSCQGERAKRGGETRRPVDGIGGTVGLPAGRRLLEFFLTTPRDSKSDHTP